MKNFYPDQYKQDKNYDIKRNYLKEQFEDYDLIFEELKNVVRNSDFTLGSSVDKLEKRC